jgi:MoaE-MoaD fusion protein
MTRRSCYPYSMQVRVLFFGMLRDVLGRSGESVPLPDGATLRELLDRYTREKPALATFLPSIALSVNQEYATRDMELRDQDEVALLPPVSGGSDAHLSGQYCAIVNRKIETREIIEGLKKSEDGAVVVFEGIVRNHTRGRQTLYLDYQAYEGMAIKQMDELVAAALSNFAIDQARIVHRLGRMGISETSVLVAVTSAHRGAAFDACRWLIDNLKKTVPIWKKEYFVDGAVWADGEPFPHEVKNLSTIKPSQATSK